MGDKISTWDQEMAEMDMNEAMDKQVSTEYINQTINEIKKLDKSNINYYSRPVKFKKPFKVRFKEFINRFKNTIS